MHNYRTPFEQFAVNASGTPVGMSGHYPSNGMQTSAGLGFIDSPPLAYGAMALGAAGIGAATVMLAKGSPKTGAIYTAGVVAVTVAAFGSGLTTMERGAFAALSLGCLGAYYYGRR